MARVYTGGGLPSFPIFANRRFSRLPRDTVTSTSELNRSELYWSKADNIHAEVVLSPCEGKKQEFSSRLVALFSPLFCYSLYWLSRSLLLEWRLQWLLLRGRRLFTRVHRHPLNLERNIKPAVPLLCAFSRRRATQCMGSGVCSVFARLPVVHAAIKIRAALFLLALNNKARAAANSSWFSQRV